MYVDAASRGTVGRKAATSTYTSKKHISHKQNILECRHFQGPMPTNDTTNNQLDTQGCQLLLLEKGITNRVCNTMHNIS